MIIKSKVLFVITRATIKYLNCVSLHPSFSKRTLTHLTSVRTKFFSPSHNVVQCQTATLRNHLQYDSSDECDYEEHYVGSDYNTFRSGKQYGRNVILKTLEDLFKCTTKEAEVMVQVCPGLLLLTAEHIMENVIDLTGRGLKSVILKDNPWLLTFKISALTVRLNFIKKIGIDDINVAIPLLQIPFHHLRDLSSGAEKEVPLIVEGSRIHHISKRLDCDPADVCSVVADHLFLQTMPLARLEQILQLLLSKY